MSNERSSTGVWWESFWLRLRDEVFCLVFWFLRHNIHNLVHGYCVLGYLRNVRSFRERDARGQIPPKDVAR